MHNGQSGQRHWTRAGKADSSQRTFGGESVRHDEYDKLVVKASRKQTETQDSEETTVRQIGVMVREMN